MTSFLYSKTMIKRLLPLLALFVIACKSKKQSADMLVKNAHVYTVNNNFDTVNAFVVKGGKILAIGKADSLENIYEATQVVDAGNKTIYPGFIDAHAHFFNYGLSLQTVNLVGTSSWNAIIDSVVAFSKDNPDGWLIGRGWDQNHWTVKQFPNKAKLDSLFPDRPVMLTRIDGHAAIVNQAALTIAGIKPGQTITGGQIETINGKLTGVLVDNATGLVSHKMPLPSDEQLQSAFTNAQANCFAVGLTTVDDCGLDYQLLPVIKQLQNENKLKMRLYVMLSDKPENYTYLFKQGIIKTPRLNVRAFKVYADGALGSRGACLLQDYSDQPKWRGFLLSDPKHFAEVAQKIADKGFQMCTHAIGDSANRMILHVYANVLKGKNDKRWRIEHAQTIAPADMQLFGANNIIPSVQPTHATSDMNWAVKRLGKTRIKSAYAYKQLLEQNGWLPLGTDFPVENINPMYTFYAAVTRQDLKGLPANGFQMENALSRKQALMGMTIWAAKANFEEKEKGSIEVGKYADFVILDKDIMTAKNAELPTVKVLKTYVNGEKVYDKN
jgi:predicted amidohydrolase YtcJ